jgi:hypothetical protein
VALVKCSSCGHQISSRARTCPKCAAAQGDDTQPEIAGTSTASSVEALPPGSAGPAASADSTGSTGSAGADDSAGLAAKSAEPPPPPTAVADWYYVTGAGRAGPVAYAVLEKLLAEGQFSKDTPVWKAGMPDWVKFSECREVVEEEAVQSQTAAKPMRNRYIWALAFAPLWGGVLQIVATEVRVATTNKTLDYYYQMWWIVVVINILVCGLDYLNFKRSGHDVGTIDKWLCLLVPVYIYRRDKIANANITRTCVWAVSCMLTVAMFVFLNGIYTRISIR